MAMAASAAEGVALGEGEATASLSSPPRYEYEDGGEGPQPPPLPPDDAYADYGEGEAAAGMDEAMVMYQLRFALEGVLMAVIANAGIFGNLVSAFILLRRRLDLQPFLCRLLVLLVVFDTVFLAGDFLTYSLPLLCQWYADNLNPILAPKFLIPLTQVALTGSVYTTVAVTVERYVSCCWPHVPPREGARTNVAAIAGIVSFSFLYNFTRFFDYTTSKHQFAPGELNEEIESVPFESLSPEIQEQLKKLQDSYPLEIVPTALRKDPLYIRYYMLAANGMVMLFLPLVSLILLNWKIHKAIKNREQFRATLTQAPKARRNSASYEATAKASKEREVTIGQILAIIVVIFVVCQSFKVIVVCYEVITHFNKGGEGGGGAGYPFWVEVVINLNHVALAFNAAVNIVIYICKDKTFRKACASLLPGWLVRCQSSSTSLLSSVLRGKSRQTALHQPDEATQAMLVEQERMRREANAGSRLSPRRDVLLPPVTSSSATITETKIEEDGDTTVCIKTQRVHFCAGADGGEREALSGGSTTASKSSSVATDEEDDEGGQENNGECCKV